MSQTNYFTKPLTSRYTLSLLLILFSFSVFAQSTYNLSAGSWEDVAIWDTDPGTTVRVDGDCDNGDLFNINENVVRTGPLYVHGGSAPMPLSNMTRIDINATLTIIGDMTTDAWAGINVSPGDTLFVDGNLDLIGGAIEVQPGAVVVVTGDCYMDTAGIDVFGDFIVLGDLTMSDAGGSIRNEGNVIIVGDLEITGTSPVIILGDSDGSDNFFVISDSSTINIENPELTEICSNQDPCVTNYGDYDNFTNEDQALVDYVTDLVNGRLCSTSISGTVTHVTCEGEADGSISITTTGFSAPVYSWKNSSESVVATTKDLENVVAGDYKIVVNQGLCIDSSSFTINDGAADVTTPVFTLGETSSRCSEKDTLSYEATASNSTGITYVLDNASLTGGNTIIDTTGEVAWDADWSGTSVITVSAEGCNGPTTATHTITINTTPDAPTASAQSFCGSATVADLASTVGANGDTVYYYTVSTGGTVLIDATALATGTYYAETVNSITGCVSSSRTSISLTINALPDAPTASAQSFCGSVTVADLASTVGANGDTVYYYTVSTGGTALIDATALATGTYYAETVNSTTGCVSSSRTSIAVTINDLPDAPTASAQSFCGSATVADLASTVGANGDTVYYYTVSTGGTVLIDATALATGTYYAETVNSTTGCVSSSRTSIAVTINVLPDAPTASAQSFCGSATVADLASTVGANGDTVYYYTVSTGGTALIDATALATGTYYAETVNSTTGCVSSSRTSIAVTINVLPVAPTVSDQTFGGSATVADLASTVGANGDTVYYYTVSSGGMALIDATALTTGTYYAETVNSSTGCSSADRTSFLVTIGSIPGAPSVSDQSFCGSTVVGDLVSFPGANGDTVYYYITSTGGTALSDATTLTTGTYYAETGNSTSGYVSATRTGFEVAVNEVPSEPTVSDQSFCGSAMVSDLESIPGTNGDTVYYYSVETGGTPLDDAEALVTGSYYAESVNSSSGCISDLRSSLSVSLESMPGDAGTITGTAAVCQNDSTTYVIDPISGATAYTWTYSGDDVVLHENDTAVTIVFGASATSGDLSVYGYSSCGQGNSSSYTITVNASVSDAGAITGETSVCARTSGVTYSITALDNVDSYQWSYTGTGATLNTGSNEITIDFSDDATSGELMVYGINATCGSGAVSPSLNITVNSIPGNAGNISGESSLCAGTSSIVYSIDAIENATSYTWAYSGSGATIDGSGTEVEVSFADAATSGDLVVYGSNTCGDGTISDAYSIDIINLPEDAGDIMGEESVCSGDIGVVYTVLEIANADSYVWEYSGYGATITNTLYAASIDFDVEATSGDLTVYGSNSCGSGQASSAMAITVKSEEECTVGQLGIITNTFTPNGDGYHDKWEINNIELFPDARIEVFDRWGRRVFMQDGGYSNSDAWDGTFDGKTLPYDNYFYVIDLLGDGSTILRGNLTIIK